MNDPRRLFTAWQTRQLLIAANEKCERCGADLSHQPFETHHIRRHADGGQTQLHNGMVLCPSCHRKEERKMPSPSNFSPRTWQTECHAKFVKHLSDGDDVFALEACMGAGKSSMAGWMAHTLLQEHGIDHVLVLVPWASIQGDTREGMLGAFGSLGIDARADFFTGSVRQARQPRPRMRATVSLYQGMCCQPAVDTVRMWQSDPQGWRFALICDEIHHTNAVNSRWGRFVEQFFEMAEVGIFMSGTYFRSDTYPFLDCIPKDAKGRPKPHYQYLYKRGVAEGVVRSVTTRNFNPELDLLKEATGYRYKRQLSELSKTELLSSEAKAEVLDPRGKCIRNMIETVHRDLMQARFKFHDAACLWVGRGGIEGTNGDEEEDRYIDLLANVIREITGEPVTVVTHHDTNSIGKIGQFRNGTDPYLVAINQVSEGCDIKRIRSVAFCRYTESEMLFRQIVGRALRTQNNEDGTAAQIYIPAFPLMVEFAERLYDEARQGENVRKRLPCPVCGQYPCVCPCPECGERPCVCLCPWCGERPCVCPPVPPEIIVMDTTPVLDGGQVGSDHVIEQYAEYAARIAEENEAHRHLNKIKTGHVLQQYDKMRKQSGVAAPVANPVLKREELRRKINKRIKRMALQSYEGKFKEVWYREVELPFKTPFRVILNTWTVEQLQNVLDRLEQRIGEMSRG